METLTGSKKEQNIVLIQHAFADFAQGNIEGILDVCAEDITWSAYHPRLFPIPTPTRAETVWVSFLLRLALSWSIKDLNPAGFMVMGTPCWSEATMKQWSKRQVKHSDMTT